MALLKIVFSLMVVVGGGNVFASEITTADLMELKPLASPVAEAKDLRMYYLWASWCPDCREKLRGEIPALEGEFPLASIQTVNMDRQQEKAVNFVADEKLKMTVLRDESKVLTKKLKLFSVPAWVVMKKEGEEWKIFGKAMGSDLKEIRKALTAASDGASTTEEGKN